MRAMMASAGSTGTGSRTTSRRDGDVSAHGELLAGELRQPLRLCFQHLRDHLADLGQRTYSGGQRIERYSAHDILGVSGICRMHCEPLHVDVGNVQGGQLHGSSPTIVRCKPVESA